MYDDKFLISRLDTPLSMLVLYIFQHNSNIQRTRLYKQLAILLFLDQLGRWDGMI